MKLRFPAFVLLLSLGIFSAFAVPALVWAGAPGQDDFTAEMDDASVPLPRDAVVVNTATGEPFAPAMTVNLDPPNAPEITMGWALDIIKQILKAFNEGNYSWAAGALMLFGLALLRRFWSFIPNDYRVYFVSGAGVVASISTGLMSGASVLHSLYMGVTAAAFASLFWACLKPLRKKFPALDKFLTTSWPFKAKEA